MNTGNTFKQKLFILFADYITMEYRTFIELVRQECRFLENDGYTFREVDRNIWYEKVGETEGHGISFAYTNMATIFM